MVGCDSISSIVSWLVKIASQVGRSAEKNKITHSFLFLPSITSIVYVQMLFETINTQHVRAQLHVFCLRGGLQGIPPKILSVGRQAKFYAGHWDGPGKQPL